MFSSSFKRLKRRLRKTPPRDSRMTLKDRALAQRLFRTFEHDLALAGVKGIHFYVRNQTVTLYGTIRHELDRDLLLSFVRRLSGVRGVIEHLQIVDQPHQDTDAELTMRL